ncbi:MAG: RNA polymerase subunit sigma-70 [Deltaproteobacteria bacterium]|nr:RNA polymerase subunit sigma-70 [Deltaproteobacteria bacterium]
MPDADDREEPARRAARVAARDSYGRLVAILSARTRDIAAAEDALSEALAIALATWPERGVPENPDAWLLTTARRKGANARRHEGVAADALGELELRLTERQEPTSHVGDERLSLLFVCAHPAIDESVRTPLMLQTVLGLDAERIGSAFLVAPATMGQRLVRAKAKIKVAGIEFRHPEPEELADRLHDVLQGVYAAFGAGWDDMAQGRGLTDEAIFLGRLLVALLPSEPEPKGLLALMLFCEARREARRDEDGRFVPLGLQDAARWSRPMILEAEALLTRASEARRFGRFQCEAAIQSVHAQRAITGVVQHHALRILYDLLMAHEPSAGVAVSRAAAMVDAGAIDEAEAALAQQAPELVERYQPYWVVRARIAEARGQDRAAREHLTRALGLTEDPAVRRFLQARLSP